MLPDLFLLGKDKKQKDDSKEKKTDWSQYQTIRYITVSDTKMCEAYDFYQ